jgi:hypothetical protein
MSNYTYHGTRDLISLPGRSVQTFPSGLVRVERSFLCRKDDVAKYRNTLRVNEPMPFDDGSPAIDSLFIFPEPQEAVRDDGFVEFRVTTYGRTNIFSEIAIERSTFLSSYIDQTQTPTSTITTPVASLNEVYIIRGVLPSSESAAALLTPPEINNPLVIPIGTNAPLVPGTIVFPNDTITSGGAILTRNQTTLIRLLIESVSSTNFGLWNEYSVSWRTDAFVSNTYRQ